MLGIVAVLALAVAGLFVPVLWIVTVVLLVGLIFYAIGLHRRSRLSKEDGGGLRRGAQG